MFHIVLSADENYMKYAAVLITSIIKHTDTSKNFKNIPMSYHTAPPPPSPLVLHTHMKR